MEQAMKAAGYLQNGVFDWPAAAYWLRLGAGL